MKTQPFNLARALAGDQVVTREGKKVSEIFHLKTINTEQKVLAVIDGYGMFFWEDSGIYTHSKLESSKDLLMLIEPQKHYGYINIYPQEKVSGIFKSREIADRFDMAARVNFPLPHNERLACIQIEWES